MISTAIKKGTAKPAWIDAAVKSMTTLNRLAAEVITKANDEGRTTNDAFPNDQRPTTADDFPVHAITDVTGFGLIGHAREMALASNVGLILNSKAIPILDGALECIRAGYIPGGLKANREFAECMVGYKRVSRKKSVRSSTIRKPPEDFWWQSRKQTPHRSRRHFEPRRSQP